ncbi:MAG: amidohydrolase family protein [Planctomycetota bacterium]|jgi:predicted TIM-barrel fold metal-dependent hydrolase
MIVDCYTHTWENADQLGRGAAVNGQRMPRWEQACDSNNTGIARHWAAAEPVDTTVVLGFKSHYLGADIPNEQVAAYVGQHADRLIGFAGIDPSEPKPAIEELRRAREQLSMRGLAVAPAAQGFHPSDSQAMVVYAEAAELRLPILYHTGVHLSATTKLEYARPVLLDEVARELPDLKIIIAHMGYPWVDETVLLLAKHENVYAEISWLLGEPWQAYQALLNAYQSGVTDKLLFGSGFPHATASHCIEELYGISHLVHGTNLPAVPREALRGIVERDTLALLGIHHATEQLTPQPTHAIADDEHEEL